MSASATTWESRAGGERGPARAPGGADLSEPVLPDRRPGRVLQRAGAEQGYRAVMFRKFGSSSSQSSPDRLSQASWLPSRRFDLGDGGERLEEHAHRRVVQGETVEGDCADQGVGRDVPVGGIDGEQSGVRDFRGQEARRVALLSHRGNSNEQGLMPKSPTAERRT
jgi:hypothetical protein